MNVADHVDRAARQSPEQSAILFEGDETTYADLALRTDRLAGALAGTGVAPGDRVALLLPNIPAFAAAYLAVEKLGAIAVSINPTLTATEADYILRDSDCIAVFTTEPWAGIVSSLGGIGSARIIVCEGRTDRHPHFDELVDEARPAYGSRRDMRWDDPAAIIYTSGTTGKQKGATLSHGNIVSNIRTTVQVLGVAPGDRLLLFVPLYHCYGQNFIMNACFEAAATVCLQRTFDPVGIAAAIEQDGVTMFFGVPSVYIALLAQEVDATRLRSVRYYFSAAAPLPADAARRWRESYGRVINEGYGLTETSPLASYNHETSYRPGSVGTPVANVDMKVVRSDGIDARPGERGELAIRGPNVMLGYWNRPTATAEVIRGGWFYTGDIGYVDADGYFYVVDRVKDMINAGGEKVWPREVEEVLYQHPAIRECAVVGVPVESGVERVAAAVVLDEEADVSSDELRRFCRQRLAAYAVPTQIEFCDALPKTATGKVLRRPLRDDLAVRDSVRGSLAYRRR